ncbi:MAG: hypothetical protein Q7R56_02120, partial [Nanoarchaeota archaeon]|nr:hypothetical protein [Nanoarchaeota archaeon]
MTSFDADYKSANDHGIFDEETNFDLRRLGVSHGVGDISEGLKANIFAGASLIELGFTGQGKSNRSQAPSPESYGKDDRAEMRLLAKINEVEISVHASPNLGPLSGFDGRGSFNPALAQSRVDEVKKSIEFAADVAGGGAVVVHTDEFPRPVFNVDETENAHIAAAIPKGKEHAFQAYGTEAEKSVVYLVDKNTGQIIDQVKRDEKIFTPEYDRKVPVLGKDGQPLNDPITGEARFLPLYKVDDHGEIKFTPETFQQFLKKDTMLEKYKNDPDYESKVAIEFFRQQKSKELERARGQADEYEIQWQQAKDKREKVDKALTFYEDLRKETNKNFSPEVAREKWEELKKDVKDIPFVPPDTLDPIEHLKELKARLEKQMAYGSEIAISSRQQVKEAEDLINNRVVSLKDFGVKKASESYAEAAMYAYEVEKKNHLDRPLFIAPEGWQTESYG